MELRCLSSFTAVPKHSYILNSSHTFTPTSWKPSFKSSPFLNLNLRLATLQFTRLNRVKASSTSQSYDEDSDWPDEEGEGWGFQLSEFFDEMRIVNKRPEDDLDYLSEDEIQWQDDSVKVTPVKGIKADDWEESVFGDIAPLVVLIFERYNRPIQNMKAREELDKAIHVFWNFEKPAPRAVMLDAAQETELASALHVKETPVTLFFKDGKLLYRETDILMADDLAKVMAHVFWGANPPECLKGKRLVEEKVPNLT